LSPPDWEDVPDGFPLSFVLRHSEGGCDQFELGNEIKLLENSICCDLVPPTSAECILGVDGADLVPIEMFEN
jgi:hypothetical protein